MAITITAYNANGDSSGIDVTAYLGTFAYPSFVPVGYGWFSTSQTDFSGNQYAVTEQANLLPDPSKQAVVFESGGGGNSIDYSILTHIVGGDLDAISFGSGLTYSAATDSFPLTQLDLRISGLGLINQFGDGTTLDNLLNDGRIGSVTTLSNLLAANAINFVGSTGADVFTGYSYNDTFTGNGGNDILNGGGGIDTAIYSGSRASYSITYNGSGAWTISGGGDGTDTLTSIEYARFADQTVALVENAAPTGLALSANVVAENSANGTVVGILSATDPNGDPLTYTLTNNAGGKFALVTDAGVAKLVVNGALDYETATSYGVTIKVSDGKGGEMTQAFTVHVTDVNENVAPTNLALSASSVEENSANGTVVGVLSATDANGDPLTYALTDDADSKFALVTDGGVTKLVVNGALDYETATSHDIAVKVSDGHGGEATQTFTVHVTDVNENVAPTNLALSASSVEENSANGTVVGVLSATDANGDPLTYALTDDADGKFALVTDAGVTKLVVNGALDYETAISHDIAVKVSDGHGGEATQTFTVNVTDVDETPPEEAPEPAGTITLDASTASARIDFESFIRGGFISDATSGGFPVFDNSSSFSGEEMLIGYGTDAASKYVLAHGVLEYFFGTHTVWGEINTIEFGRLGSGTYDANGYFNGGDVELRITGLTDFANAVSPEAEVEATGEVHNFAAAYMSGSAADPARLSLFGDQLDQYAQHFIGSAYNDVYAGTLFDDTIEGNGGIDLLAGGGGNDAIDGGDGTDTAVFTGDKADYTITNDGNGTWTVIDNRTGNATDGTDTLVNIELAQFADQTVALELPNNAPADLALSANEIAENSTTGTVIGILSATDADNDPLSYALTDDAGGKFALVTDEGVTKLVVNGALDYEAATSHEVTVKVSDGNGGEATQTFTVSVTDVDEGGEQAPHPVIDASALGSVDFPSYVSNFLASADLSDLHIFLDGSEDNHTGTEWLWVYGTGAARTYVLFEGEIAFDSATTALISLSIDSVEYGAYGAGSFDAEGHFSGGDTQVQITGLALEGEQGFAFANDHVNGLFDPAALADLLATLAATSQEFIGTNGSDVYTGTDFDDTITGNGGDDVDDGGEGVDTAVFTGNRADYTITANGEHTYTVIDNRTGDTIDGTDTLTNVEFAQFADETVTLEEIENQAPTDIALSNTTILESARTGATVGTLSATDPEGGAITWSLPSAQGDNNGFNLKINDDGSVSVILNGPLDHESSGGVYDLVVTATDADGNATTETIAITVDDDPFKLSSVPTGKDYTSVMENSPIGTKIGFVLQFDTSFVPATVELTDDARGLFSVSLGDVGGTSYYYLTVNGNLDHEVADLHAVTIKATDAGGVSQEKTFQVHVLDAPEATDAGLTARGTITIDANTALADTNGGVNWDSYLDAYFAKIVPNLPIFLPVGSGWSADTPSSEFLYMNTTDGTMISLRGSDLLYNWTDPVSGEDAHVVSGTITEMAFGNGGPTGDAYAVTDPELIISGLDLTNDSDLMNRIWGDAQITAQAWMYGPNGTSPGDIEFVKAKLASYAQNFIGSAGNDVYTGTLFDDTVTGNGGSDLLAGGGGDDMIDGGEGDDAAVFTGNRADYTITNNGNGTWTVTDNRAGDATDGTDTLTGVELAQFADQTIGLVENGTPVASADSASAVKNLAKVIDVLSNDTDLDGALDPSSVTIVDGPDHGTVTVNATTGVITYTPTTGYVGADSFTYTVKDDAGAVSNEATVSLEVASGITLTSGDDVFIADALGYRTALEIDGGDGNDYISTSNIPGGTGYPYADTVHGGDGNDLIIAGSGDDYVDGGAGDDVIAARGGTETVLGGEGSDTFVLRFFGNQSSATTDTGTTTIIDTDGVLWNGSFRPDSYPSAWDPAPAATQGYAIKGTASAVSAGVWDLAVADDTGGTEHLTLNWTGEDLSIVGGNETVIIKDYVNGTFGITLEDSTPVAQDDSYAVTLGQTLHIAGPGVLGNDSDADGDDLMAQLVSGTDDGLFTFNADGSFDFQPYFAGATSFTYVATDGAGNTNLATVTVDVGIGADTADFSANTANTVKLATGTLSNVIGGSGADTIAGNANIGGTLSGGAGNDTIVGGNGHDAIIGGVGNDRLTGRGGDDTFVFRDGFGKDTITDFQVGDTVHHDTLDLRGLGFSSIEDVLAATSDTPNAVIAAGDDSITLTFVNKTALALHASDIILV